MESWFRVLGWHDLLSSDLALCHTPRPPVNTQGIRAVESSMGARLTPSCMCLQVLLGAPLQRRRGPEEGRVPQLQLRDTAF
ncbi:unnamed protein product [Boreogadus saida]